MNLPFVDGGAPFLVGGVRASVVVPKDWELLLFLLAFVLVCALLLMVLLAFKVLVLPSSFVANAGVVIEWVLRLVSSGFIIAPAQNRAISLI